MVEANDSAPSEAPGAAPPAGTASGPPLSAPPPGRSVWRSRLAGVGINLLILTLLFGAVEAWMRYVHTPSPGLTRFVFLQEMSRERWDYLEEHRDSSLLDEVRKEQKPVRRANAEYMEEPEGDRPPYDRVRRRYHVRTNNLGFRDSPFRQAKTAGTRRVLLLGDSLTYGKGMPADQRFSDRLRAVLPAHIEIMNAGDLGCNIECQLEVLQLMLPFGPDLVVLQPSGNDMDQSMWRIAVESSGGGIPRFRWAYRSRFIQSLAYWFAGDSQSAQVEAALASASSFYAETLASFFAACRRAKVPVVVMNFPAANGVWYGEHVADACRAQPGTCLGVIRVDFDQPERWMASGRPPPAVTEPPEWIVETADLMDLDAEVLASLFPHLRFFSDLVHPNGYTHQVAAAQLHEFFRTSWPGWIAP